MALKKLLGQIKDQFSLTTTIIGKRYDKNVPTRDQTGTLRVLNVRDNHYTMETSDRM